MFTASFSLPYFISTLMMDEKLVVTDLYSHRPDRLVFDSLEGGFFAESLCNEVSNVSAISLRAGMDYFLPSNLFRRYFLGV